MTHRILSELITTHRSLDFGNYVLHNGLTIRSQVVWENPNASDVPSLYYHEYSTKRSAINTAELMGHRYVLKLIFDSATASGVVRYVATDGSSYDEAKEAIE